MSGARFERRIPPRGPVLLRGPRGEVPAGYAGLGPRWAVALPADLLAAGVTVRDGRLVHALSAAPADLPARLRGFWAGALRDLLPDPLHVPPVAAAGLVDAALASPLTDEAGRAEQLRAYLAARAGRGTPAGVPAAVDRALRMIAVLPLPAEARAVLSVEPGRWRLRFDETGALQSLLDRLVADPAPKPAAREQTWRLLGAPPAAAERAPDAQGLALARAVQLARILLAAGSAGSERLEIAVSHPGLDGSRVVLDLAPQDRGLGLMRLARAVGQALAGTAGLPPLGELRAGPQVALLPGAGAEPPAPPHAAPLPLQWQRDGAAGLPRLTWSGTGGVGDPALVALPFAVAPRNHALVPVPQDRPAFPRLPGADRLAYVDWLDGPRRAAGFRPEFGHLYLQGLEYRLLRDSVPVDEAAELAAEIAAVGQLGEGLPLAGAAAALLDWLGATGRRPGGDPALDGPLTRLAGLGRHVAAGQPLDGSRLQVLARLIHPHDPGGAAPGFLSAAAALWPGGLILRPPRIGLAGTYVSLSGLCDRPGHRFLTDAGAPVPDLRCSLRLQAALAQVLAQAAEGPG